MADEPKKQAVVDDPNAPAEPVSQGQDAREGQDDLDVLLAEFDKSTKPAAPVSPTPTQTETQPDQIGPSEIQQFRNMLQEQRDAKFRQDIEATIKEVRGDLDPEFFDDVMVEGWLNGMAIRDPRLATAWLDKSQRPKINQQLGKLLAKKAERRIDRPATEDRAAVVHAVRGASHPVPTEPAPNFGNMSDNELREYTRKNFGF